MLAGKFLTWLKVQDFQNPELLKLNFKTNSMPTKIIAMSHLNGQLS